MRPVGASFALCPAALCQARRRTYQSADSIEGTTAACLNDELGSTASWWLKQIAARAPKPLHVEVNELPKTLDPSEPHQCDHRMAVSEIPPADCVARLATERGRARLGRRTLLAVAPLVTRSASLRHIAITPEALRGRSPSHGPCATGHTGQAMQSRLWCSLAYRLPMPVGGRSIGPRRESLAPRRSSLASPRHGTSASEARASVRPSTLTP